MSLHLGIRRSRKHRAADAGPRISELEQALARALSRQAEAEQVVVCLDADLVERTEERDQLLAEVAAVRALLAPYLAAEANAAAVTVPEMERDTSAIEDQATAPIRVTTLREQFGVNA
ncbi:hypothetical protein [Streptomyces sp. NRRL S-15]|uniref:hypothetical protein n=1 Tax=Streptomyces sp. NRRL S-15 TaxID=1463886 RepID=UPI0004CB0921|nr:hypothetical protein [Streptomyces sp. NRRL S-15]